MVVGVVSVVVLWVATAAVRVVVATMVVVAMVAEDRSAGRGLRSPQTRSCDLSSSKK